jgi:hypothetical protein
MCLNAKGSSAEQAFPLEIALLFGIVSSIMVEISQAKNATIKGIVNAIIIFPVAIVISKVIIKNASAIAKPQAAQSARYWFGEYFIFAEYK